MLDADPIVADTAARICADLCTPELINAAEDGAWPAALWDALQDTGLSLAWVPESAGGPGATLADGFTVARTTARSAAPVPIAETLLAGWLLSSAGLAVPPGPMTVAPLRASGHIRCDASGKLYGSAGSVPFAGRSEHLVVIARHGDAADAEIALVPAAACDCSSGTNLAGEAQGVVSFDGATCVARGTLLVAEPLEALQCLGAAMRAQQMAGALERILDLSLAYSRERFQFGRPIARFQAIQHNLATLAGEVAAGGAAADAAAAALIRHGVDDPRTLFAVAAAKIRAGEAAGAGAAIAHQVHGAMGFTREYSLHHSTRRLWAWRDDFGPESVWATRLGEIAIARGAAGLWPALTSL